MPYVGVDCTHLNWPPRMPYKSFHSSTISAPLVTQLQAAASSFKEPSSHNNPLPMPHLMVTGNLVHQKGERASAVMISSTSQHVDVENFKDVLGI